jgi:hypothetical protein
MKEAEAKPVREEPSALLLRCLHETAFLDAHRERLEIAGRMDPLHEDLWRVTQKSNVALGGELLQRLLDLRMQELALQKICVQQRRALMARLPKYDEHQMLEEEEGRLYRLCTAHCDLSDSYCQLEYWPQGTSHAQQALEFAKRGEQLGVGWAHSFTGQNLHLQMLALAYLRSIFHGLQGGEDEEGVSLRLLRKETMRQMKENRKVRQALSQLALDKRAPWEIIARAINPTRLKGTGRTLASWAHFVQVLRSLPTFQEVLSRMAIRLPQQTLVAAFRVFMEVFQQEKATADPAADKNSLAGFVPWQALADAIGADVALVEELNLQNVVAEGAEGAEGGGSDEQQGSIRWQIQALLGVVLKEEEGGEGEEGGDGGDDGEGEGVVGVAEEATGETIGDQPLPPPVEHEGGVMCWEEVMVCLYCQTQRLGTQTTLDGQRGSVGVTTLVHEQLQQLSASLHRMVGYDLRAGLLRLVAPALCARMREHETASRAAAITAAKQRSRGGKPGAAQGAVEGEKDEGADSEKAVAAAAAGAAAAEEAAVGAVSRAGRLGRRWWEALLVQPASSSDTLDGLLQLAALAQAEVVSKLQREWPGGELMVRNAADPPPVVVANGEDEAEGEGEKEGGGGDAAGHATYLFDPGALTSKQCYERCVAPDCFSIYGRYRQRQRQRQRALEGAEYAVDLNPDQHSSWKIDGVHPRTRFNPGTGWNMSGAKQQLLHQQEAESELLQQRHNRGMRRLRNVEVNGTKIPNLADGSIENNQLKDSRAQAMEAAHRQELQQLHMLHDMQRRKLKASSATDGQTAESAAATAGAQAARAAMNVALARAAAAEDAGTAAMVRDTGGNGNGKGYRRVVDAARAWVVVEDEEGMKKAVDAIHMLFSTDSVLYDDGASERGEEGSERDLSGWRVRRMVVQCQVAHGGRKVWVLAEIQLQLRSLADVYARGLHETHTQQWLASAVDRLVSDSMGMQRDEPLPPPVLRAIVWRALRAPALDRAAVAVAVSAAERTGRGILADDSDRADSGVEGGATQLATACKPRALVLLARCSAGAMRPTSKVGCKSRYYQTAGWAHDKGVIKRSIDSKKKDPNRITSLFGYLPSGEEGPSREKKQLGKEADHSEGDGDDRALGLLEEAVAMQERMVGRRHLRSCGMYALLAETLARIHQRHVSEGRAHRRAEALEWATSIGSTDHSGGGRAGRDEGEGATALRWAPKTLGVSAVHDEAVVRWAVSVETGGGEAIFRELAAQKLVEMEANKRPGEDTRPRALAEARREVAEAKFEILEGKDLQQRRGRRRKQRVWTRERRAKRKAARAEAAEAKAGASPAAVAVEGGDEGGDNEQPPMSNDQEERGSRSDEDDADGDAEEEGVEGVDMLHCAMGYLRRILRIRTKAFGRDHYSLIPIHARMAGYCVLGHEEEDEEEDEDDINGEETEGGDTGGGEDDGGGASGVEEKNDTDDPDAGTDVGERYRLRSKCLAYAEGGDEGKGDAGGEDGGGGGGKATRVQPMARRCTLGAAARHLSAAIRLCCLARNQDLLLLPVDTAGGTPVEAEAGGPVVTDTPEVDGAAVAEGEGVACDDDDEVFTDVRSSLPRQLPVAVELMKRLALVREAIQEKCEEQWEQGQHEERLAGATDEEGRDVYGEGQGEGVGREPVGQEPVGEERQRLRDRLLSTWLAESEELRSRAAGARHAEAVVLWRCKPNVALDTNADSPAVVASPLQMHAATLMLQACAADAVQLWSRVALQRAQAGRHVAAMSALKLGAVRAAEYTYAARTNTQTGGGGSMVWRARACQQHAQLHLLLGVDGEGNKTAAAVEGRGGGGGDSMPDLAGVGGMNGGWAAAKAALMPLLHALRSRYGTRDEKVRTINKLAIALESAADVVTNPVLLVGEDEGAEDEGESKGGAGPMAAAVAEKIAVEEEAAAAAAEEAEAEDGGEGEGEAAEDEDWGVVAEGPQTVLCMGARLLQTEVASYLAPELPEPSSVASSFSGMAEAPAVREEDWEERLRLVKAAAYAWVGVAKLVMGASLRHADSSREEAKELKDPAGVWLVVYKALQSAHKGLKREQRLQQALEELQDTDAILSVKEGERAEGLREVVSETLAMTVNLERTMQCVKKCVLDAGAVGREAAPAQRMTLLQKYKENAAKAISVVSSLYQLGRE